MSPVDLLPKTHKALREWWHISPQSEHYLTPLLKLKGATENDDLKCKIWGYIHLLEGHLLYLEIFDLLKSESFYQAWCKLEELEMTLASLRNNREYVDEDFGQSFLNNAVNSWQMLYPYKLFFSSREIIKKMSCSICQIPRSVFGGCHHRRGKLYAGELCNDVIEELDIITFDLVSNPVVKAAVLMESGGDRYDYSLLRAGLSIAATPRSWFTTFKTSVPITNHTGVHSPSFTCPCMRSIRNYEDCCMHRLNIESNHIVFDVLAPRRSVLSVLDKASA